MSNHYLITYHYILCKLYSVKKKSESLNIYIFQKIRIFETLKGFDLFFEHFV